MADPLRFHPQVANDVRDAASWYDGISPELGNRFREQLERCFDRIEASPDGFAVAFDDVSFVPLERFPYLLLLCRLGGATHLLGLFHASSDPANWRERRDDVA